MQHACHKMEIGGVANRRLRLVRHQFDAVCLHHANIDRPRRGIRRTALMPWSARSANCWSSRWRAKVYLSFYRQYDEAAAQRSTPQPAQTVPQPGSMEWHAEQKKSR